MAYLSPLFEHDVFVSYSHGDPKGLGSSPLKTWSRALVEALIADISALSDEFDGLDIWFDRDFDPTLMLTPEVRRRVKAAGILMVLMSPRYLKSAWCGDERAWFQEQVDERSMDEGRVFVVRAVPTDHEAWPSFLRDKRGHALIGFCFHPPRQRPEDVVEPFGWPDLIDSNIPFRRELAKLRTALTRRLREIKVRAGRTSNITDAQMVQAALSPERAPRIYLHARPEHVAQREPIERMLHALGDCRIVAPAQVLADGDPARWQRESKARIETATDCDVLALLRPTPDPAFLGDLLDVGVYERERIRAARGAPLPCAILDGSGAPLEVDTTRLGIERFDLHRSDWPAAFLAWIGQIRIAVTASTS